MKDNRGSIIKGLRHFLSRKRSKKPIRAVIFDVGGVLLQTEHSRGRQKWETLLGLEEGELFRIVMESDVATLATLGQLPEPELWLHLATKLGIPLEQASELEQDFWAGDQLNGLLVQFIMKEIRPYYSTAILSNAWPEAREKFTQIFKLDNVVDMLIISAEEGLAKPDQQIYLIAARKLDVNPVEIIFIDDLLVNVEAAKAIGMHGIHFKNTKQIIDEIKNNLQ
jgi:putative hydrolase of the HAD superfamily